MFARHTTINLQFKFPAQTSRGILLNKPTSFLILEKDGATGIGECSTIPYLSIDPQDSYLEKLNELCFMINNGVNPSTFDLKAYPSIAFGLEIALLDLMANGTKCLFSNDFTSGKAGIPINGLVWMGDKNFMQKQIRQKIAEGYKCIKLKVGAIDFETELQIINDIRKQYNASEIELRLDANGAFSPSDAIEKLEKLAKFNIHSIEQPIRQGQLAAMAHICQKSPIPIVLDEELIGLASNAKETLLESLKPAYIILKPSLLGGFKNSEEWIKFAQKFNIQWWITSALESNIGLNAIAQWTFTHKSPLPQGLGTGQIYNNNIPSPLDINQAQLFYHPANKWDLNSIIA